MTPECARPKIYFLQRQHALTLLFFLETRGELLYLWSESRWAYGCSVHLRGLAVSCGMKPPSFFRNALRGVAADIRELQRAGWHLRPKAQRLYDEPHPPKKERPRCGAQCRTGLPCKAPVWWKEGEPAPQRRCRLHGGLSTGPKTEEGKAKISSAVKARWEAWRAAKKPPTEQSSKASPLAPP